MVTQAPGNGGGGSDRDVIFRLGIGRHPDTKKNLDELNRQVGAVQKGITQKSQDTAREQIKAAKQAADEQVEQFKKVQQAAREFAKQSRELNERFVSETKGAAQGLITLGRGFATLGLAGEESTEKILKGLVRIQGAADTAFGSLEAIVQGMKSIATFRDLGELALSGGGRGGIAGAAARGGASFLSRAGSTAAGGAAVQGGIAGVKALAGGGAAAAGGAGAAGAAGASGIAASIAAFLGSTAAVAGTAAGTFSAGQLVRAKGFSGDGDISGTLVVQGLAKLSEATDISANNLISFGGIFPRLNGDIAKSADELVAARKSLAESEKTAAKIRDNQIAESRRKAVEGVEAGGLVGEFNVRNQQAAERDRLRAQQLAFGDTNRQRELINQFAQKRAVNQFRTLGQLAGQGGAQGEAAKQLRGQARDQLIGLGQEKIGLLEQAGGRRDAELASFERERESAIARIDLDNERRKKSGKPEDLAAIAAANKQKGKLEVELSDRRALEVKLDAADEDLKRRLINDISALIDKRQAALLQDVTDGVNARLEAANQQTNEQLTGRKTQFRGASP